MDIKVVEGFNCDPRLDTTDLVADVAEVAEELVVVCLTVGQPLALVVPVAKERLLTLGAHEVLHTPVLAQRRHHAALHSQASFKLRPGDQE